MPNQRSKSKVRVTVPMPKTLEKQLRLECERRGLNRVDLIKEACEAYLKATIQNNNNTNGNTITGHGNHI
jgi:metal-responsive CopG/Arc/MetJ family transcriptional regulator